MIFFLFNSSSTIFPQTLTILHLYDNQIGAKGAEHLANALQQNKVTELISIFFLFNSSSTIFPQTLTTLHLGWNHIGDQGAEHLANALQQNKVTHVAPI